ncbi:MAG TPA: hypothetical protein VMC41_00670 [Candidatus Nanoarchaeia archaeon]|nr:hypothetical protein [Candidatus Nanoarchaeia archaeon]
MLSKLIAATAFIAAISLSVAAEPYCTDAKDTTKPAAPTISAKTADSLDQIGKEYIAVHHQKASRPNFAIASVEAIYPGYNVTRIRAIAYGEIVISTMTQRDLAVRYAKTGKANIITVTIDE